jgi:hypothetical protein
MLKDITIAERGAVPRILRKDFGRESKRSWDYAGGQHHVNFWRARFKPAHARKAKYAKRKGELLARSTKQFRRSYFGRKYWSGSHGGGMQKANPLWWSGTSKRRATFAKIAPTRKGVKIRYNTPAFNLRPRGGRINMREEFTRVLMSEKARVIRWYDDDVDKRLKRMPGARKLVIRA